MRVVARRSQQHCQVDLLFGRSVIEVEDGRASITDDDELLTAFAGAQVVVRARAERIFPNCPRYIHRLTTTEPSPYVPQIGCSPPVPKWKRMEMFADVLPREGDD